MARRISLALLVVLLAVALFLVLSRGRSRVRGVETRTSDAPSEAGVVAPAPLAAGGLDAGARTREQVPVAAAAEADPGTLAWRFRIVSTPGAVPLAAARMEVLRGGELAGERTADAAGEIAVPPLHGVALRFSAAEHFPRFVSAGELELFDVAGGGLRVVELYPEGVLEVHVRTPDGAPVVGAGLDVRPREDRFPARLGKEWPWFREPGSDARMRAQVLGMAPPTELYREAETDGSGTWIGGGFPCGVPLLVRVMWKAPTASGEVVIDPVARVGTVTLETTAGCIVRGRVVLSDGSPPPEPKWVQLRGADLHDRMDGTDKSGHYEFEGVPQGACAVWLMPREGLDPLRIEVDQPLVLAPDLVVDLAWLSGTLVSRWPIGAEDFGLLLCREGVELSRLSGPRFNVQRAPGHYTLVVRRRTSLDDSAVVVEVPVSVPDEGFELDVDPYLGCLRVRAEGVVDPLEVRARLHVEDRPLHAGAKLASRFVSKSDLTPVEGEVELPHLVPGTWDVDVRDRAGLLLGSARAVVVSAGTITSVALVSAGVRVTGRLLRAGEPAAGWTLLLDGARPREARTDDAGRFAWSDVLPGEHALSATQGAAAVRLEPLVVGDEDLDVELVIPVPGAVRVLVRRGGVPVDGARVSLSRFPLTLGQPVRAQTDRHGTARFDAVLPGTYRVSAFHDDGGTRSSAHVEVHDGRTTEVELDAAPSERRVEFQVDGAPLRGLRSVRAVQAQASGGWLESSGRIEGATVYLPLHDGPTVFVVQEAVGAMNLNDTLYERIGFAQVAADDAALTVELASFALEVVRAPDAVGSLDVYVEEVGGVPVSEVNGIYLRPHLEPADGAFRVRLGCASLRGYLRGVVGSGVSRWVPFDVRAGAPRILTFP